MHLCIFHTAPHPYFFPIPLSPQAFWIVPWRPGVSREVLVGVSVSDSHKKSTHLFEFFFKQFFFLYIPYSSWYIFLRKNFFLDTSQVQNFQLFSVIIFFNVSEHCDLFCFCSQMYKNCKIWKIDFSFVSEHSASFLTKKWKLLFLRGGGVSMSWTRKNQ